MYIDILFACFGSLHFGTLVATQKSWLQFSLPFAVFHMLLRRVTQKVEMSKTVWQSPLEPVFRTVEK